MPKLAGKAIPLADRIDSLTKKSELCERLEGDKVRFGLVGVKNVGSGAIQEVLGAREQGPFVSFSDFLERVNLSKVNRKVIEALIQAGAFDDLEKKRARLLAGVGDGLERIQRSKSLHTAMQMSMFGALAERARDDWLP